MAGSPTIKGDNTVLWGSSGVYATGIIVSGSKRATGEEAEIPDNAGFTTALVLFDDKDECEFEMIVQTAAPSIARGDFLTICGVEDCIAKEVEEMWAQKDVRKFRVRATRYSEIEAP